MEYILIFFITVKHEKSRLFYYKAINIYMERYIWCVYIFEPNNWQPLDAKRNFNRLFRTYIVHYICFSRKFKRYSGKPGRVKLIKVGQQSIAHRFVRVQWAPNGFDNVMFTSCLALNLQSHFSILSRLKRRTLTFVANNSRW